jgi:hypothetical protein
MLTIHFDGEHGDLERRIRAEAQRRGQDVQDFVLALLSRSVQEESQTSTEDTDQWAKFHKAVQKARESRVDTSENRDVTFEAVHEGDDLFDAYLQAARRGEALPGEEE